jgi:AmmeMemoRadiSam system protein A
MIPEPDRRRLLALARDSITACAQGMPRPEIAAPGGGERRAGLFVSLHKHGDLRGCIGRLDTDEPLSRIVADCARSACSADPRFPPVAPAELPDIDIELSVLGDLESVASPDDVVVGQHGLVVELGRARGLLLPQVATQWGWDARSFVEQACRKAGLPPDAWQHGAKMWRFEAEVFTESRPR